jgi:hypothetical protein
MVSRQLAGRPKLLTATAPEDTPDVDDDDEIDADEEAAAERARESRRRPTDDELEALPVTGGPAPATPRASRPPAAKKKAPAKRSPAKSSSTSTKKPAAGLSSFGSTHDGSGVLLGLVVYALFLAYVKGGWAGVRQWLAAKFLNKTGPSSTSDNNGFPPGTTYDPKSGIVTPGDGGRPYRLVPDGPNGQFSQEPIPGGPTNPNPQNPTNQPGKPGYSPLLPTIA